MGKSQCEIKVSKEAGSGKGVGKVKEIEKWCVDESWPALDWILIFDKMLCN